MPSPTSMSAMRLHTAGTALSLDSVARPVPQDHEILLEVLACGVCYADAEAAPLLCAGLIGYRAYRARRS